MKVIKVTTEIEQYNNLEELPQDEVQLIKKAREAAHKSYSPYSEFKVGAAILLENGEIIIGNNQENAAYPSGLCAERTAIFWANSNYPDIAIKKLAISAIKDEQLVSKPISPCGSCRQVMIETETRFNTKIKTLLDSSSEIWAIDSSKDLLPLFFYRENLE